MRRQGVQPSPSLSKRLHFFAAQVFLYAPFYHANVITRYIFFGATPPKVGTSVGVIVGWCLIGLVFYFLAHEIRDGWDRRKDPGVPSGDAPLSDVSSESRDITVAAASSVVPRLADDDVHHAVPKTI